MHATFPVRSPWRLSWKMVNRMAALPLEELRERLVDRLEEALLLFLLLGRHLLHQQLLQVERGLRALQVIDGEARLDDVVELLRVGLSRKRLHRNQPVLLLAHVATL